MIRKGTLLVHDLLPDHTAVRAFECTDVQEGYLQPVGLPDIFNYSGLSSVQKESIGQLTPGDLIEVEYEDSLASQELMLTSAKKREYFENPAPNSSFILAEDIFPSQQILRGIPYYREPSGLLSPDVDNAFDEQT